MDLVNVNENDINDTTVDTAIGINLFPLLNVGLLILALIALTDTFNVMSIICYMMEPILDLVYDLLRLIVFFVVEMLIIALENMWKISLFCVFFILILCVVDVDF